MPQADEIVAPWMPPDSAKIIVPAGGSTSAWMPPDSAQIISGGGLYDTKLNPTEESEFEKWKSKYAPNDSGVDYDFRGAFKSGLEPADNGHWPDTYKKPNHPTFSVESIYAKQAPELAGKWNGETYVPPTPEIVSPADANPEQKSALYKRLAARANTTEKQRRLARFVEDVETPKLPVDSALKDAVQAAGAPAAIAGRITGGLAADVSRQIFHPLRSTMDEEGLFKNFRAALTTSPDVPLPTERDLATESGVGAAIQRGLLGAAKLSGEMLTLGPLSRLRIPSIVSTPAVFGGATYAETGDPKAATISAVLGVAFPVVDKLATEYAGQVTKNLLTAKKITDTQAKAVEAGIKVTAMQTTMQALSLPDYIQHPEKWKEIFAENAAMGLAFHAKDALKIADISAESLGKELINQDFRKYVTEVSYDLAKDVKSGKFLEADKVVNDALAKLYPQEPVNPEVPVEPGPIGEIPAGGTIPQPRQRMRVRLPKKESVQNALPITPANEVHVRETPKNSEAVVEGIPAAEKPAQESPQPQAEVKAEAPTPNEGVLTTAKELGLTAKPPEKAAGVDIPKDLSRYSEQDQKKLRELAASMPTVIELTDRQKGSPTEGLTIHPKQEATRDEVLAMWNQAKEGYTPIEKRAEPAKLSWQRNPGGKNQAPISFAGDYVISERPDLFTLSYRPKGEHNPLGQFKSLQEAKDAAEKHGSRSPKTETAPPVISEKASEVKQEAVQKYKVGKDPHLVSIVERMKQTETEKENGEQPVRVKDDQTGKISVVDESDLTPVKERTAEEKAAAKASKRDLDKELIAAKLDPASFSNDKQKRDALKRAKKKGIINGSKLESWADEVLRGGGTHGGTDVIAAYIVKGAALIEQGVTAFADWSKQMLDEYGDKFRPYLQTVWEKANTTYEEAKAKGESPEPPEPPSGGTPSAPPTPPETPVGDRTVPPSRPETNLGQVAGVEKIGDEYEVEKIAPTQEKIRANFFDGTQEVAPELTERARNILYELTDPQTRVAAVDRLKQELGDADMASGLLQSELWTYANKLVRQGDDSLLRFMVANHSAFEQIGSGGGTSRTTARIFRALLETSKNPTWKISKNIAKEASKLAGEKWGIGEQALNEIIDAIKNLKLDPDEVLKALREGKDKKGRSIEEIIAQEVPEDFRSDEQNFAREIEKEQAKASSSAEKSAQRIMDNLEKKPGAGAEWVMPDKLKDIVRQIVAEFLRPKKGYEKALVDESFNRDLRDRLTEVGVERATAVRLALAVYNQATREWVDMRERAAQNAAKYGSLKSLKEAVQLSPYRAQQDPAWRQKTAENWFMANGLSRDQAEGAARVFSEQYQKALDIAVIKLVKGMLKKKHSEPRDLEEFIKAIRLGLTDPSGDFTRVFAEKAGWKPPTLEQHQKLAELEEKLSKEGLSAPEIAAITEEMMGVYRHMKLPPPLITSIAASFVATNLTGLRTLTVNMMAPMGMLLTERALGSVTNFKDFKNLWKTFGDSMMNWLKHSEVRYAMSKDAAHFLDSELHGANNELKRIWENAVEDIKSEDGLKRASGYLRAVYGAQQYSMRLLSAYDQANMVMARDNQLILHATSAFRDAGLGTKEIDALVMAATNLKRAAYEDAVQHGRTPNEARVISDAIAAEQLQKFIANEVGDTAARKVADAAEKDAYSVVGRRAPGIQEVDEGGILSRTIFNHMLALSTKLRGSPGTGPVAGVYLFGYMNTAFRTARFMAWNSPYGLLRLGIHHFRKARANGNPQWENHWKQSLANDLQERHRLKMAVAATAAQVLIVGGLGAWVAQNNTSNYDKNKTGVYFTGHGPKNKTLRDAWLKNGFQPNSIVIALPFGKRITLPMSRIGEPLAHILWPFAALDDRGWRKKEAEAAGRKFDETPLASVMNAVGSYASLLGQRGFIQNVTQWANLGSNDASLAKVITSQVSSLAASATQPFLGFQRSVMDMITGPVDKTSIESTIAAAFPVLGAPWQNKAVNRFGDALYDQSWYARMARTGIPIAFKVADTPENQKLYTALLAKGATPPELRRYILEERYGAISDDQWSKFAKQSGTLLKQSAQANLSQIERMDPEQAKKFLTAEATKANATTAARLGLESQRVSAKASTTSPAAAISLAAPIAATKRVSAGRPTRTRLRSRGRSPARGRVPRLRAATRRRVGRTRISSRPPTVRLPRLRIAA